MLIDKTQGVYCDICKKSYGLFMNVEVDCLEGRCGQ